MPDEEHDHPEMEEVRAKHHLAAPQELRRLGAPGVLSLVEAQDAADDQHRDRQVGIPAEEQIVDELVHLSLPQLLVACPTARRAAPIFATTPVGPPPGCSGALKSTGASSHSSSIDLACSSR